MGDPKRAPEMMAALADYVPWTRLRLVSNNQVARLVILIPIIGYWIIFNDWLVERTRLVIDPGSPEPAVSWRLYWTYFGLCAAGAASLLYQVLCPQEIKQFATKIDFVAGAEPHLTGYEAARMGSAVAAGDESSKKRNHDLNLSFEMRARGKMAPGEWEKLIDSQRRETMGIYFDLQNRSLPLARLLVSFIYSFGMAMLAVPSINVFIRVCAKVLGH